MPQKESSSEIRLPTGLIEIGVGLSLTKDRDIFKPIKKYILNSTTIPLNIRSVNAITTIVNTDTTVVFTVSGIVQPLPTSFNKIINLKNGSTGSISITGNIDGTAASTITVPAKNSLTFHGDGTTWWII